MNIHRIVRGSTTNEVAFASSAQTLQGIVSRKISSLTMKYKNGYREEIGKAAQKSTIVRFICSNKI